MHVAEIAKKILELINAVKTTSSSPDDIAFKVNSILIFGEGLSLTILGDGWDFLAQQHGLKNSVKMSGGSVCG